MTYTVLDNSQIEEALENLHVAWSAIPGQGLVRVFETDSFAEGVALVGKLAEVAEQLGHHPDVHLSPAEVEVTLLTHGAGGITQRDIEFAKVIDSKLTK